MNYLYSSVLKFFVDPSDAHIHNIIIFKQRITKKNLNFLKCIIFRCPEMTQYGLYWVISGHLKIMHLKKNRKISIFFCNSREQMLSNNS
jgi:hypothetical protein